MTDFVQWTTADAAAHIAVPGPGDHKYSRGVLGIVTGSDEYPGAAVLGVDAALRAGVGMVRYLGPERASSFVLQARPETVTSNGRVQAWLIGSGMDYANLGPAAEERIDEAFGQELPVILDGGAVQLTARAKAAVVITPHHGELARVLGTGRDEVEADPGAAAIRAAGELGATVLLKGHSTHIASPEGTRLLVPSASPWLATAGSGDSLAGVLGSIVATHSAGIAEDPALLARLAATASVIHLAAAERASRGGPFTVLDLNRELGSAVAAILGQR